MATAVTAAGEMVLYAGAALARKNLLDWGVIVVDLTDTKVEVRPKRKVVALTKEFVETGDAERLVAMLSELLPPKKDYVYHPAGEFCAECPACRRLFYREKPPAVQHLCGACLVPLKFE